MKNVLRTLFFVLLISFSCKRKDSIEPQLFNEIKNYIKQSEDYAKTTSAYHERNIYIVKFKTIDSSQYIKLFENSYYDKKGLDGYITIGDNKVFFYNSNGKFVDKDLLQSSRNLQEPDEYSNKVDEGFNSLSWYFEIKKDLSLVKIHDEDFIFY